MKLESQDKNIFVFRIARKLKKVLSLPLFLEMVTSGVIMSFCFFDIFTAESYMSVKFAAKIQFTIYAIVELLIFTRASENIKRESERIADKIYSHDWYNIRHDEKNLRQIILISMQCANQPVTMSAMGFSEMTYKTFVIVSRLLKFMSSPMR